MSRIVFSKDIAQIRFNYEEGDYNYFFVPWEDDEVNEYKNGLQNAEIIQDTLKIRIGVIISR